MYLSTLRTPLRDNPRLVRAATVLGGLLLMIIPAADDIFRQYPSFIVVVGPILLLLGAETLSVQSKDSYKRAEKAGFRMLSVGIIIWTFSFGIITYTFSIEAGYMIIIPLAAIALLGIGTVALGSAIVGYTLWQTTAVPQWVAAFFAIALLLDVSINFYATLVLGSGISFYGLAWICVGYYL